ncbi:putative late blight resistance protein homolog R1A-3 isoform X2 [Salvia hispanica]|uniref:putative late blight resistance protein homolog R1A-3 isoform X2 n=1 Tax=Salvia hispanica TaxID=49212 RepID=UPI00200947AA|nr:putative late blight resistance protein homolog R1A-3 isoform X2 [Salvia hispanica]
MTKLGVETHNQCINSQRVIHASMPEGKDRALGSIAGKSMIFRQMSSLIQLVLIFWLFALETFMEHTLLAAQILDSICSSNITEYSSSCAKMLLRWIMHISRHYTYRRSNVRPCMSKVVKSSKETPTYCTISMFGSINTLQLLVNLHKCFCNFTVAHVKFLQKLQSLQKTVDFLVNFVENYSEEGEDLMRPIGHAAREAKDMIEVEAAHQITTLSASKSLTMLLRLEKMIREMSSITDKVIKFKEETPSVRSTPQPSSLSSSSSSPVPRAANKTSMLGFDGYMAQLLDELIGHDSRRILPIVGMGGAGKTTLAKNVYEDSHVVYHFDVRAWITVSQEYNATHMLSQALSCLQVRDIENKTDDQLGEKLHQTLFGRRYMIVLDDVWSVASWEKIMPYFPENGNGSRIVVTTRQQEVVNYIGSSSLAVGFLDYQNSWDLFCEVTFAQQNCPPQLQEIAKIIVTKCGGLPLAIRVIGGLLRKVPRTKKYWEEITNDKSLVMEYSEDHQINASRLIKLWVAEGFIKASKNQNLEQVAESYIKELVDTNLLLVGRLTVHKKVENYCVHDLVRELCIKTAEKEDFYCVQRDIDGRRHHIFDERSTSFYQESVTSEKPSVDEPLILSLQREAPFKSRLLRVFCGNGESMLDISLKQINLRYAYYKYHDESHGIRKIPRSISLCWCLQTLIVFNLYPVVLPSEIWRMLQLRHIDICDHIQIDPPAAGDVSVLQNLQTLKTVKNLIFSEELCAKIPNIRELNIHCDLKEESDILYELEEKFELDRCMRLNTTVGSLSKLELLSIGSPSKFEFPSTDDGFKLPNSLIGLTVGNCTIGRRAMEMIALLPNLQLLELSDAVSGSEWNFFLQKFHSLKHLTVSFSTCLINWIVDKSNFPVLETLYLSSLLHLEEIPLDIGEISTLQQITVCECSESANMSAIKILEEQENLGNQALQVIINFGSAAKLTKIDKIKEPYTSKNLQIYRNVLRLERHTWVHKRRLRKMLST